MTRGRVIALMLLAAVMAAGALELPWLSSTSTVVGTTRAVRVSLAGGAALPSGSALVLVLLILVVGAWVLPWWVRTMFAAGGAVLALFVAVEAIRWLADPDTSALVSGNAQISVWGPALFILAALIATWACMAMARSARLWPGLSNRYERQRGARSADPRDQWSALDRGVDPTE